MGELAGEARDPRDTRAVGRAEAARPTADLDSRVLFGGAKLVTIRHGGDVYTLRITRAGKLILTK